MVPTLPAKVLSIKGRAAAEKAIKPPPATSPIVAAPTKKKRLKAKRAKKAKAKANLNSEVINVLDSEDDEEAKANGAGEAIVSFNGGRDLASPEAGPSRITLDVIGTAQTPSAFVPLRRSMLSGMSRISASPERKIEGKTANGIQFMIDDTPSRPSAANTSGSRTPVVSEHFQPPPLFSASLPTSNGAATSEGVSDGKPNTGSEDITTGANLMLPQHVSLSDKPVENAIVDDSGDPEDDSMEGLHFLDDDKVRGVQRYFDPSEQTEEASFLANADQSKICPNCKKPGHRQYQCPHVVCTTCGAMDEHERRDCPHGLVCFGCGQRGHRQSDCPDPVSRASRKRGCDRCGSREHPESSCPTLWRVYAYWSTSQRADMLEGKRKAEGWAREAIGGDEYEEWCYNCAKSGHLGDDCPRQRASQARLFFPSAFSHSMASRGPFFSQTRLQKLMEATPVHARWDDDDSPLPYVTPKFGGLNAGKKTADKAKRAMIDREAGEIDEDDEDDWFNARRGEPSQRGISIRGRGKSTPMAGGRRPWDSENRPGVGKAKATGREPLPFSHSHLMASAPASSKGKGIQFGKLSLPETPNGSNNDSPTAKQAKKRGVGQSGNLLSRALENSSREAGSRSGSPMVKGPTSLSVPPSDSSDGSSSSKKRRKKRKEANDEQDRDPESRWWESGNGGGKVTSWGRELDKSDAGLKEKKKPATSGQRYVGGY